MPKKQRQATRATPGYTGPFKGNPQQGTLFDKRGLLNPEQHIGPRGYSPERIRAIRATGIADKLRVHYQSVESARDSLVGLGRSRGHRSQDERPGASEVSEAAQGYSGLHDTIPEVGPDVSAYGPAYLGSKHNNMDEEPRSDTSRKQMLRAKAKMTEDLARSTVKPEHLEGLTDIYVRNQSRGNASYIGPAAKIAGAYRKTDVGRGHITLIPEEQDSPDDKGREPARGPVNLSDSFTLLHELGHHVSHLQHTEHSQYRTPAQQGREEAFADNYAIDNYREDRRTRNWAQIGSFDPRTQSYPARGVDISRFGYNSTPSTMHANYRLKPENREPSKPSLATPELEHKERPQLPGLDEGHVEGFSGYSDAPGIYGRMRQVTNQKRIRPVSEMQQAYIKSRWDPRNR